MNESFMRIPVSVMESVVGKKLNGTQYSLLLVIWKYTYGIGCAANSMSLSFFVDKTGYTTRAVKNGIRFLIDKNVLIVTKPETKRDARRIMFNEDYGSWKL